MSSSALIKLVLQELGCSQKELANKLAVSPTQISKWKKGEYMAKDMEERIIHLLGIDDLPAQFILHVGTIQKAREWYKFMIDWLPFIGSEETGYTNLLLEVETNIVICDLFDIFNKIAYALPENIPTSLSFDDSTDEECEEIFCNPFVELLSEIITAFNDLYGFYYAYVHYLLDYFNLNDDIQEILFQFESDLLSLAVTKIEIPNNIAPNFKDFQYQITIQYQNWINAIKLKALQYNIPLKVELMNFIAHSAGELGHDAERESLGFNQHRLHPDIYMNELLVGMRIIHQILPVILEKLEIKDFHLDESKLSN